jgi:hypothetical protein
MAYQITKAQHVFPEAAIRRFCKREKTKDVVNVFAIPTHGATSGTVTVHITLPRQISAQNKVFCAERAWDDHAESVIQKRIEDRYHTVAEKYKRDNPVLDLNPDESNAITDMYILWQARARFRDAPQDPITLRGIERDPSLDDPEAQRKLCYQWDLEKAVKKSAQKNEEFNQQKFDQEWADERQRLGPITEQEFSDRLEQKNIGTLRLNGEGGHGATPARQMHGMQMQLFSNYLHFKWGIIQWACFVLPNVNIVVPDQFEAFPYLPLTPTRCFIALGNSLPRGIMPNNPHFIPIPSEKAPTNRLRNLVESDPVAVGNWLNEYARWQSKRYYFQYPI